MTKLNFTISTKYPFKVENKDTNVILIPQECIMVCRNSIEYLLIMSIYNKYTIMLLQDWSYIWDIKGFVDIREPKENYWGLRLKFVTVFHNRHLI